MEGRNVTPLRLALVVQGRFFMFDLARELIRLGHDVTLFTNSPKNRGTIAANRRRGNSTLLRSAI